MLQEIFFNELASSSPTPGGGTVSALAGQLAGGLLAMVLGISAPQETIQEIKTQALELEKLALADAQAYQQVVLAFKLPKNDEAEKAARQKAVEAALKGAAEVPLKTAKTALALLLKAQSLTEMVKKSCATDLGVAISLLKSSLLGGLMNVEINLLAIKDEEFNREMRNQIQKIKREAKTALLIIAQEINSRQLPIVWEL